ncbi:MAG: hypothetical protein ABL930_00805 [Pseudobdellovibrio sp.]
MKRIICLGLLITAKLQALPTLYPENFNRVRNNTNSNIVADSESAQRFYVLPPNSSFAKVRGLHTVTANVGFCKEIANLQEYNLDTLSLLNSMKTKDISFKNQLEEQNKKLSSAKEELSKYVIANNMQELAALDFKILQLERRLDDLYLKSKNCNNECVALSQDIQDTQKLRMELTTRRFELSSSDLMAANEYEKKKTYTESLQKNIEDIQINWKRLQTDLKDLYVDFNRMFDAHAKREGGRVAIEYKSGWSENIARLMQDNPHFSFEKIQTKNANIKMSAYSKNNLSLEGAVTAFDVGGISANGVLTLESFPENLSGNVTLNLLGVCPLLHPDWFNIKNPSSVQDMNYGLTVGYEYPANMKYDITVNYNMYRMYSIIKSQGQSGGFFSSSSWSDQQEEELFRDSFRVDWKIQDDKMQLSFDKKLEVESDLRRQMMTRLASNLVMNDSGAKMGAALGVPQTGATVLSNSLSKACPANLYCRGASVVLDVLQAIFGASSTQQSLTQISNVNMTEKYSHSYIVMQPMLTTYQ